MKGKLVIYILIIILVSSFVIILLNGANSKLNYNSVLKKIEIGNEFVIAQDLSDECLSSYRYYHRGCYYDKNQGLMELQATTGAIIGGNLQEFNLTHTEIIDLCKTLAHKGQAVSCLKENNEKALCLEFAGDNEYLKIICNLENGQVIGQSSECEQSICHIPMSYSDLG